jgi:MFS family permease
MSRTHDTFRRSGLAIAALFALLGFQYATWASRLPALKTRLGASDAEVGLLLTVCGIGAAASFPLVAALMKRLGSRRLAELSALCLSLLPLAIGLAPNYPTALAITCCDGIAVACLDVAMNAQGAVLESAYQRTVMARLHATFSGGALAGALLAAAVNAVTADLLAHFAIAAALLLALLGFAHTGLLRDATTHVDPEPPDSPATLTPSQAKPPRRPLVPPVAFLWMGAAMAFGTIVEGAMNDWSALYLKNVAKAPAELTPMGIAGFSVTMVLARLMADRWRTLRGDRTLVTLGSATAGGGLALAVLIRGTPPALLGFACVGLGIAAVTPCIYKAAADRGPDSLAIVAAMGTVGLLAGPGIIGLIASASGLAWAMAAVAAAAIIVSLCATRIPWPSTPSPALPPSPKPESATESTPAPVAPSPSETPTHPVSATPAASTPTP